jgi:aryl-alcohol dehydrogenase-like predicted oxidoreductase
VLDRSIERDIIPMVRPEGLALAPWNVLRAGKIRTDGESVRRRDREKRTARSTVLTGKTRGGEKGMPRSRAGRKGSRDREY